MIPKQKIDEIVDAAHIEDVVGGYVHLKKRGANLTGLCPFHQEKTPSFSVSPSKGIYKCFGCGQAGNAVNFIMDVEQLSYIEALKQLAEKYNIEWPQQEISQEEIFREKKAASERESLQVVNNFAENHFAQNIWDDEEGRLIGLSYFEERGFRHDIIKKFKLGFAKDSWDNLYQTAEKSGFNLDFLVLGGLVKKQPDSNKLYDAYRNRVIFPIHSISGKPIAFAGRYLVKDEKSPKYVNSPETPLYHKSNELYGLYFAKQSIIQQNLVYLVEGYTDVITLHQAGIENVVASSGTSLTDGQIKLIKRFTNNVCVLYDGDQAGVKASLRGTDMLLEAGLNVKIVSFPAGEDPDSYCKTLGPLGFTNYLNTNQQDFIFFKASLLLQDAGNDPIKRAELIKDIVSSISKIPDVFKRSVFLTETSKLLEVSEQLLINEANKLVRNKASEEAKTELANQALVVDSEQEALLNQIENLQTSDCQEKDVIRVLLEYGDKPYSDEYPTVAYYVVQHVLENEIEIQHPVAAEIIAEIHQMLLSGSVKTNLFVRHQNPLISAFVADVLSQDFEVSKNWTQKYDVEIEPRESIYLSDVNSAMLRLKIKHFEKLMTDNQKELERFEKEGNIEQVDIHLKLHVYLTDERSKLTKTVETIITR